VDGFDGLWYESGFVPPPTTNNRMELYAQIAALQDLHSSYGPCEIEIVSDSAYVVLGCQDHTRQRVVNNDLWDQLDLLVKFHIHVQWRHVRGHKQVKYNELADQLAVKAKKEARWNE
jgi:ribonuclease HI